MRDTNKSKRERAERALKDAKIRQLSDREIARRLDVSHAFITKLRARLERDGAIPKTPTRIGLTALGRKYLRRM